MFGAGVKKINLKNVVWREGKYYVAQCLNIDISSFGKTKQEALKNLNEALELYFEDNNTASVGIVERPEVVRRDFVYA